MTMLATLMTLSAIHILAAMTPGPNTVLVAHLAAGRSTREALMAVAGITLATFVWVTLSLAGVGLLLREAGEIYALLRFAGACWLVWAGLRMLRSATWKHAGTSATGDPAAPFRAGLVTTLSNPKSGVFWTSVFVVAMPPHAPAALFAAATALVLVQTTLWYGFVALTLSAAPARRVYARSARWLEGLAGAVMVGFGLRLAFTPDAPAR